MSARPEVPAPRLSVIVPARNAAAMLSESLPALRRSDLAGVEWELIVVDDGSTDSTAAVATAHADRVLVLGSGARGPAHARNRGAEAARGEILAFIDADVCVHADALRRLVAALDARPDVAAVFGAYDTRPAAQGLVTQYRNLLHHYVHAQNAGAADTFWAGCGAIRSETFQRAGGFDERRYPRPQIEDIDLGYRLRALGCRIVLLPEIQGTHLKRWTLGGMMRGDLFDRAIPWMHLLLGREAAGAGSLNIRRREKLITAVAGLAVLALAAALLTLSWPWAFLALGCALIVILANLPLFRWLARERSPAFALGAVPLHLLYYMLSAAAVAIAVVQRLSGGTARGRTDRIRTIERQVV